MGLQNIKNIKKILSIKHKKKQSIKRKLVRRRILKRNILSLLRIKNKFFPLNKRLLKLRTFSRRYRLSRFIWKSTLLRQKGLSYLINRKVFSRLLPNLRSKYFLLPNKKNRLLKYKLLTLHILGNRRKKNKIILKRKFVRTKIRTRLFIGGSFFYLYTKFATNKKLKNIKKHHKRLFSGKFRQNLDRSHFQKLEKFSVFKLFRYLKGKRQVYSRKNVKKFRINYRGYPKHKVRFSKRRFNSQRTNRARAKKKPKNLVFKNKVWCVQVKKSDGRLIYRPLKLSDFLSSRSGWRTRTTSFRKRISKSGKPLLFIRFILRPRNEYDSFVFKKRKIYNYYKKIYKYIEWKFRHYRTLFRKYSLSRHKYTSFNDISRQFAWNILSSRIIQAKASNLSDSFSNSLRYLLFANSVKLWQLSQSTFVNSAMPSSFYTQCHAEKNIGLQFQNRPYLYNWNKRYRIAYNKNTRLVHQFQKPFRVYAVPSLIFKSSSIFSWYNLRFANLISNRQRHFAR